MFQSPRSGKFVSNASFKERKQQMISKLFQSPISGKFVLDWLVLIALKMQPSFNPLDRGNLYQISKRNLKKKRKTCFTVSIP